MKGRGSATSAADYYTGVIHIHSAYSHDGHDSILEISQKLQSQLIDFCVLTDHFEDFDAQKFSRYLTEVAEVNATQCTVFVPAIEAEIEGFHIVLFPVTSYDAVKAVVDRKILSGREMVKFLAHPVKYPPAEVAKFLMQQNVDGVEIWNQQADGNYLPPDRLLRYLSDALDVEFPAVFFGCDIHNMKHRLNNVLRVAKGSDLTPGLIVERLKKGEFLNYNRNRSSYVCGNASRKEMLLWLDELQRQRNLKAAVIPSIHRYMKFLYHLLPRTAQPILNDLKNAVKSWL